MSFYALAWEVSMRASLLKFLAPAAICLIVSGCGGAAGGGGGGGGNGGGGGGNTPATVTVSFAGTPTALAAQVGSRAFTTATLASGTLTLNIPSGTTNFAVAYICPDGGYTQQIVLEASTLDATSYSAPYCASTATLPTGTLTGSGDVSAIAGAGYLGVTADSGSGSSEGFLLTVTGDPEPISVALPSGTDRVAVTGYYLANPVVFSSGENLLAVRNFEGVTIPGTLNGGNAVTLGAADEVTMQPITYKNVPSGFPAPTTTAYYDWGDGGDLLLSNDATTQYPAIPAAASESGDYYSFGAVTEMSTNGGATEAGVSVATNTTANGPVTFTFPAPWIYAGPTPSAQPVFNMANSGITGKTGVMDFFTLAWNVTAAGQTNSEVIATANYLNGSTSLTVPNLTGVSGFLSGPPSGGLVVWFADVEQSTAASLQPLGQNGTIVDVENGGSFTVP
jgi:hypothetical protein